MHESRSWQRIIYLNRIPASSEFAKGYEAVVLDDSAKGRRPCIDAGDVANDGISKLAAHRCPVRDITFSQGHGAFRRVAEYAYRLLAVPTLRIWSYKTADSQRK